MIIYIKFKRCVLYIVLHISNTLNIKLLSDVIDINVLHFALLLLHKFHSLITGPQRDAAKVSVPQILTRMKCYTCS